jgi:hypothetical protein
MTLRPAISVRLGGQRFEAHAAEVRVSLGLLPAVDEARLRLPSGLEIEASPGDEAELTLDGGEGAQVVLTGTLSGRASGFEGHRLTLAGAGHRLARLRPATTYQAQPVAAIVADLADQAEVSSGRIEATTELVTFAAHAASGAHEHVARLAEISGGLARFGADGALEVLSWPSGTPERRLRYGRELVRYAAGPRSIGATVVVRVGSGSATAARAPDALLPTVEALPEGAPEAGPDTIRVSTPFLRTPTAARDATDAATRRRAAQGTTVRASALLQPGLRPGAVVDVADLPAGLDAGPWLITRVRHRLVPGGAGRTDFEGWAASPPDLAGALSGLASAVGGLL